MIKSQLATKRRPGTHGAQAAAESEDEPRCGRAPADDFLAQHVSMLSPARCVRHPFNRTPKAADVDAMLAGMRELQAEGKPHQREAIIVRLLPPGDRDRPNIAGPVWQIISGETRQLAIMKLGGPIAARVIQCDDARAFELVIEFNRDRNNLDPMQEAAQLRNLMRPVKEGGCGFTLKAAGAKFGVSESEAGNRVRLLDLPAHWAELVAAGLLKPTLARELLSVLHVPAVIDELLAEFAKLQAGEPSAFASREVLHSAIDLMLASQPTLADLKKPPGKKVLAELHVVEFKPTKTRREALAIITNLEKYRELTGHAAPRGPDTAELEELTGHKCHDTPSAGAATRDAVDGRQKPRRDPEPTKPATLAADTDAPAATTRPPDDDDEPPLGMPPEVGAARRAELMVNAVLDCGLETILATWGRERLAAALKISARETWLTMQASHTKERRRWKEIIESCNKAELQSAAAEWKIHLEPSDSLTKIIRKITTQARALPLPSFLDPKAKPRKRK